MLDIKSLLNELKKAPYEEISVAAPHCGILETIITETGQRVHGVSGTWKEKPGTLLATINREHNKKPLYAPQKGEIVHIEDVHGQFVEAGTLLFRIRHFLTKEEVIQRILRQTLHLFLAPEKGKYYFCPEVETKIKAKGCQSVLVRPGDELFILSRMKRETYIAYQGDEGIIYTVYFEPNKSMERESPLIGVCPEKELGTIQEVVARIQSEWEEKE
ncbi:biotin/lipoyl attachment domain-containing protein [Desulfoplanes sp.]